jgi:hypothetical protein
VPQRVGQVGIAALDVGGVGESEGIIHGGLPPGAVKAPAGALNAVPGSPGVGGADWSDG